MPQIGIVGAGIAGLSAAVALKKNDIEFQLVDYRKEPLAGGTALVLWPNALLSLTQLDLFSSRTYFMHEINQADIRTGQDKVIHTLPLEWIKRKAGFFPVCVMRQDLQKLLWEYIDKPAILQEQCVSIKDTTLEFSDNKKRSFDAIIAADGIHSKIRTQLFGSTYRPTHYVAWRGIAKIANIQENTMREYWAKGARFGYATIDSDTVYWFATINLNLLPIDENLWDTAFYSFVEHSFPRQAVLCVESTEQLFRNSIEDIQPGILMSLQKVALIGDAAHAITPNLGLGACIALEDAAILSQCLQDQSKPWAELFRQYAFKRSKRVKQIAQFTRKMGNILQWQNNSGINVRNKMVEMMPGFFIKHAWSWILQFDEMNKGSN